MEYRLTTHALCLLALCIAAASALPSDDRPCVSDRDCMFTKTCVDSRCICKEGYHLHKGSCLGGVGSICHYDEDCIVDAFCEDHSSCACMKGLTSSEQGSKCHGNVTVLGRIQNSTCRENFQCEEYGMAFCEAKTNLCQCRVDAHLRNAHCWESRKLGENCLASDQCLTPYHPNNVECEATNHTCVCKNGTKLSADRLSCEGSPGAAAVNLSSALALLASYLLATMLSS